MLTTDELSKMFMGLMCLYLMVIFWVGVKKLLHPLIVISLMGQSFFLLILGLYVIFLLGESELDPTIKTKCFFLTDKEVEIYYFDTASLYPRTFNEFRDKKFTKEVIKEYLSYLDSRNGWVELSLVYLMSPDDYEKLIKEKSWKHKNDCYSGGKIYYE